MQWEGQVVAIKTFQIQYHNWHENIPHKTYKTND